MSVASPPPEIILKNRLWKGVGHAQAIKILFYGNFNFSVHCYQKRKNIVFSTAKNEFIGNSLIEKVRPTSSYRLLACAKYPALLPPGIFMNMPIAKE